MKQLRRIDINTTADPYRKAQRGALRYLVLSEAEFRELERKRPGHIIVDGDAVLIGEASAGAIGLQYAFPDRDAFARRFPSMLQGLLSAVDLQEAPLGVRFRLTERSDRPYLEPVLFANAFEVVREWLRMTLPELPEGGPAKDELAPGFLLRPAVPADADAIAELDAVAFLMPSLTAPVARQLIEQAPTFRVLEDSAAGRAVGYLRLREDAPDVGYVTDVAVHPEWQRRGLGEATMRWALAWFRSQGLKRAALKVNTDNAAAIALYRKLGFTPNQIGLDYRRPLDEEEVRQVLERHRAVHIRVRKR